MKFTLSWLKTHLDTDASLTAITDRLTAIGLELETVSDRGAELAPFRVAQVIEAVPHPNADRLRACKVDTGAGIVTVVCGAPNARTGMKAVFAPPGSYIPGTAVTLKVGEIRGVESAGMLLSLREMGLGDDHSGIVDLPEDAPVGMPYAAWAKLDDPVIDISVTPNRGDALSVRGVARDLAAAGVGTLRPLPRYASVTPEFASPIQWQLDMPASCPWVLGRAFRNLRNGPSPVWLRERLTSIGLRPINALVDVTNFFTFDLGRPLHVFDLAKLTGDTLVIRPGKAETLRALDGRDYLATNEDCVIADGAGVQSLAGLMGGATTGCDEATTSMFLECALFDPVPIALTGRRLQITSDARQRFERGVDQAFLPEAIEAASALILEICGGAASEIVSAGAEPAWQRTATLRFSRLNALSGVAVPPGEAVSALTRLGFGAVAEDSQTVTVSVPPWRNDVAGRGSLDLSPTLSKERADKAASGCAEIEPEADLIEEVLRLRGLDTIPPVSLQKLAAVPPPTLTPRQSRAALARRSLAARGYTECVTFSFMAHDAAARFGTAPASLRLVNPIAADLDQLRPTPLATLAEAALRNAARGFSDVALFEIGPAFASDGAGGQQVVAAAWRSGYSPRSWSAARRPADPLEAKGDALALIAALGVPLDSVTATPDAPTYYHPGRSGVLRQGPKLILAQFGEIHPGVLAALDVPGPVTGIEIFLDRIPEPKRRGKKPPDLPALQPLQRDFAFLADENTSADAVLRAARSADRGLITAVTLFDVFPMQGGKKSLGVEITIQPQERTPTDAEIEAICAKVVAAVSKATGAGLR
jgi:phenylalanyl-tRNA synthetase beta chain